MNVAIRVFFFISFVCITFGIFSFFSLLQKRIQTYEIDWETLPPLTRSSSPKHDLPLHEKSVFIAIFSTINNLNRRNLIRNTWMAHIQKYFATKSIKVDIRFILADISSWIEESKKKLKEEEEIKNAKTVDPQKLESKKSEFEEVNKLIEDIDSEYRTHKDVISLVSASEGYRSLSRRLKSLLELVSQR
eukprot:TRINITY_DN5339_c0_g1_i2.p2 TRINITY_DN5339_c0_g1~~TRINITY_DN5339_c0_g1_i2.p2  ORF type:complete len:189 (-),score=46.29 TRINITY_DN5339_c0_g1_i2:901-1467(-)